MSASRRSSTGSNATKGGCCARFIWEFKVASLFGLEEPDGSILDVKGCFASEGKWRTVLRALFFLWNLASLIANLVIYPDENLFIFMGYLTHITWVLVILYQLLVVLLSTWCKPTQPPNGSPPGVLVKLTWILYSIAAPGSLVVILLYWFLDYEPGVEVGYYNFMKHGISGLMIWFDGLVVGLIPVRLKHFWFFLAYAVAYLAWNYAHSYYQIGNGTFEDDALYDALRWNENQESALLISVLVVTFLVPACYLLFWGLSLISGCSCSGARRPTVAARGNKGSSSSSNYVSMSAV